MPLADDSETKISSPNLFPKIRLVHFTSHSALPLGCLRCSSDHNPLFSCQPPGKRQLHCLSAFCLKPWFCLHSSHSLTSHIPIHHQFLLLHLLNTSESDHFSPFLPWSKPLSSVTWMTAEGSSLVPASSVILSTIYSALSSYSEPFTKWIT